MLVQKIKKFSTTLQQWKIYIYSKLSTACCSVVRRLYIRNNNFSKRRRGALPNRTRAPE